ncbi:unnamed protein product, partial [marine sediment metagenome]
NSGGPNPIIHRVVKKSQENGNFYFQTKGDNNINSIKSSSLNEIRITENQIIGVGVFKVPWFGWIKIEFVDLLKNIGVL